MLVQASQGQFGSAHVVVLGNEKGGSGKSTSALHIAVALMKAGQRVATIDLDCRQQSFTRYIANRSAWARRTGLDLEIPVHYCVKLGETMQIADNENSEFQQFMEAVSAIERAFDFAHRLHELLELGIFIVGDLHRLAELDAVVHRDFEVETGAPCPRAPIGDVAGKTLLAAVEIDGGDTLS